jgi:HAD superfamily hydrolase (TIGR01509 family)
MLRAIFWDNDGVLVDTEHVYFRATQHVLAEIGIQLTEADYVQLFLVQGRGAWHLAEAIGIGREEIVKLRDRRNAVYAEWLERSPRIVPGITQTLDALHGKYVMGIVTSSRKDHFDVIHRTTGLLKYFEFVLTSEDFTRVKPDPEPYLRAIERSGVAAEECVAIEDSRRGLESALAAGIRCIVVPTGLTRGSLFTGAHKILQDVSEIPSALSAD